ncbi:unnamed protein product [Diabrotica balteata]|uniref:BED-type domain-containing protein n=1 Tax=Diabrotica balteata TaxID=107213 RepID=A0A9N9XFQ0_DIABA|nr:unnamed protein product [Diabrotica balteata]
MSSSESEISKPKMKKIKYFQKYKEEWEKLPEFVGWLKKSTKGELAFCKSCNKDINIKSGKDSIIKHSNTNIHKQKCNAIATQRPITRFMKTGISSKTLEESSKTLEDSPKTLEEEIKEAKIRLEAFIAKHNLPPCAIEHLPHLIKKILPDSKIAEGLASSWTKTSAIE